MPKEWRALRAEVLADAGHRCQLCGAVASEVDHIVPRAAGGSHGKANLRALCSACHGSVTGRYGGRRSGEERR